MYNSVILSKICAVHLKDENEIYDEMKVVYL